jgi:hypothetical protein
MMQWGLGAQAYTVGELRLQNGQRRNHLGKVIPYISAEVRVMA